MNVIKVNELITVFQFPSQGKYHMGTNITVLEKNNEVIIIDTGYEHYMAEVKPYLEGKKIKYVICTHFHPDHCYGLHELEKQVVIGSEKALDTLTMFNDENDQLLIPSIAITENTKMKFFDHSLEFVLNPGHSLCGMLIIVDNKYLFVGDDIMYTTNNESIMPYIAASVQDHINSLTTIKNQLQGKIIIPAHGVVLDNYEETIDDINHKIAYLEYIKQGHKDLSKFTEQYKVSFVNEIWHRLNITR